MLLPFVLSAFGQRHLAVEGVFRHSSIDQKEKSGMERTCSKNRSRKGSEENI
jgi:hypothetical protein